MQIANNALLKRQAEGKPIRVGMIGLIVSSFYIASAVLRLGWRMRADNAY